ncbi:Sterol 3-beta-glucosyltransferase UGT80B1 [Neonectria ditissima]|uniref:Sterol 3-beta-glucosyltransferase UGT80B1 n=1 Tax=Neonectria ditissima TaxID=78410 RepID=A0A0N8H7P6_9HYPO|nr:Sterol 3-beta-glucosyltransferase UGT80B1 [Neonectria ditissima]
MAQQDEMAWSDSPPSYHDVSYNRLLNQNLITRDDGRVDLELNTRVVKTLSVLLPNFKSPGPHNTAEPTESPPAYSVGDATNAKSTTCPVKLNIVIQVVGSRGDVQPFIALRCELQKHGHRIRIATHDIFASFIRAAGLEFYPVGGDPEELMSFMVRNPGLIPSMKSLRAGDVQKKRRMVREMLNGFWDSCILPDPVTSTPFVANALIANPPSFAHIHCAQVLGIPVHLMFTMPWTSTRAFPHPLANIKLGRNFGLDLQTANYISYGAVEFLTWQGLGDVINGWRDSIDLEPVAFSEGPRLAETLNIPFTYYVCGFFFREPPNYNPPPALDDLLRRGPPPVYIGFGSIVIENPEKLSATLLEAVARTGVRALISRGWSKLGGPEGDNIMYLDDCPHEWLFRHVAAVVHHGGAGTTACGLLNGRPTTIVPFFGDQPFWGDMVAAAGAGPKPIPYKTLNAENLAEAIEFCLQTDVVLAAGVIASKMQTKSGVKAAVASFHANLPRQGLECGIIPGQPASWVYKGKHGTLKLSNVAAQILSDHSKVNFRKLKMHATRQISIETRRWDPVTGTISTASVVSSDMLRATADIVIKPVKVYQKHTKAAPMQPEDGQSMLPYSGQNVGSEMQLKQIDRRNCVTGVGAAAVASASGVANLVGYYVSGFVKIPFAFTEGLRNVPHLYGEEIRDYGTISDLKSGTVAGGKVLVYGLVDGVMDVFVLPYKGAKHGGALGAVKGVGKGVASISSKLFAEYGDSNHGGRYVSLARYVQKR